MGYKWLGMGVGEEYNEGFGGWSLEVIDGFVACKFTGKP